MITNLKPYPAYKDSGVPWLGEIPEHWCVECLKRIVQNINDQTSSKEVGDTYIALENVESWTGRLILKREDVEFVSQVKRFKPNDILYGKLRPYLAKVTRPVFRGVCVGEFLVLRTKGFHASSEFVEQIIRSFPAIHLVNSSTYGAKMPRAEWAFIGNMLIAIPYLDEQAAIVRYLTHIDLLVNRFIRAKQRLIKLLNEQKQAIIHQAVTRGLDPQVRMKPSGIEWLREIPETWSVIRCGHLFTEVVDTGHPEEQLLSIDRFKGIIPQNETGRRTRASRDRSAYKYITTGQLAYNLMNAFMGALGFSEHEGIVSPAYAVAKPLTPIVTRYFHYLLRTPIYQYEYSRLSYGIMYERNRLYFERFKLVKALFPPLEEQHRIVDWIEVNTSSVNDAIIRTEREVQLIREYRTRLIADVVTGKLDVREITLPAILNDNLPAAEEFDGLDETDEMGDAEDFADADE